VPTAVLVDAGFFLKRLPRCEPNIPRYDPEFSARRLHEIALSHMEQKGDQSARHLYRIFVYDCPPLTKKLRLPISGQDIDYSQTQQATFRSRFHEELKQKRKIALRLGYLQDNPGGWVLKAKQLKSLLTGKRSFSQLTDEDFTYDFRQKGVDMRIGLDIASLSYKEHVDQIVLVSGDADFVPAAKLARREGIDFILDPMWQQVSDDLFEHIDGLRSTAARPNRTESEKV